MITKTANRRWFDPGHVCIVAASGPSLNADVARQCEGFDVIVVNDAYKLMPWAGFLFATDARWWKFNSGVMNFKGEKWTSHSEGTNNKAGIANKFGLNCIRGTDRPFFSDKNDVVHYGCNSGYSAVNLAIHFGAERIILVGFDMRKVNGRSHFFGDHVRPLHNTPGHTYNKFIGRFANAAKRLPRGVVILNATPESAMTCFPMMPLKEALSNG